MTVAPVVAADLDDAELMLRVQADDQDAFGALFDRFATRVRRPRSVGRIGRYICYHGC